MRHIHVSILVAALAWSAPLSAEAQPFCGFLDTTQEAAAPGGPIFSPTDDLAVIIGRVTCEQPTGQGQESGFGPPCMGTTPQGAWSIPPVSAGMRQIGVCVINRATNQRALFTAGVRIQKRAGLISFDVDSVPLEADLAGCDGYTYGAPGDRLQVVTDAGDDLIGFHRGAPVNCLQMGAGVGTRIDIGGVGDVHRRDPFGLDVSPGPGRDVVFGGNESDVLSEQSTAFVPFGTGTVGDGSEDFQCGFDGVDFLHGSNDDSPFQNDCFFAGSGPWVDTCFANYDVNPMGAPYATADEQTQCSATFPDPEWSPSPITAGACGRSNVPMSVPSDPLHTVSIASLCDAPLSPSPFAILFPPAP